MVLAEEPPQNAKCLRLRCFSKSIPALKCVYRGKVAQCVGGIEMLPEYPPLDFQRSGQKLFGGCVISLRDIQTAQIVHALESSRVFFPQQPAPQFESLFQLFPCCRQ